MTANGESACAAKARIAELIAQRFKLAAQRLGLATRLPALDTTLFRLPERAGDQLKLF